MGEGAPLPDAPRSGCTLSPPVQATPVANGMSQAVPTTMLVVGAAFDVHFAAGGAGLRKWCVRQRTGTHGDDPKVSCQSGLCAGAAVHMGGRAECGGSPHMVRGVFGAGVASVPWYCAARQS